MILGIFLTWLIIMVDARTVVDRGVFSEKFDPIEYFLPWRNAAVKRNVSNENRTVCQTDECDVFVKMILSFMDKSADPCKDFYQYACGNAPAQISSLWDSTFIDEQVKKIITSEAKSDDIPAVKFMKSYYKSCVDVDEMEKRGIERLRTIVAGIGGWPLIMDRDDWNEEEFDWQKVDDYYARLTGNHAFFLVDLYDAGSDEIYLQLKPLSKIEPRETEEEFEGSGSEGSGNTDENDDTEGDDDDDDDDDDDEEMDNDNQRRIMKRMRMFQTRSVHERSPHARAITDVAITLASADFIEASKARLFADIEDLLDFYKQLLQLKASNNAGIWYAQVWQDSYDNHVESNSKIDWISKLEDFLHEAGIDVAISNKEIVIEDDDYFIKLSSLLDKTPKRTIVNFIHWSFLSKVMQTSNSELRNSWRVWNNVYSDETIDEREDRCVDELKNSDMVAYEYVKMSHLDTYIEMAKDVLKDIREEVEDEIENATWMDEQTKKNLSAKISHMNTYFAYPDWLKDTDIVNRYFEGLTVGLSYSENFLTYNRYLKLKNLRRLSNEYPFKGPFNDLTEIGGYYWEDFNTIVIPAGTFMTSSFAHSRPKVVDYVMIGGLLGHEMNHGVDNDGYKYDKNGKHWDWLPTMADAYNERAECFVEQFNKYSLMKDENVTVENYGRRTLSENIADTMGFHAAYKAFKKQEEKNCVDNKGLPGLEEFDDDQLFFLTFAATTCEEKAEYPEEVLESAKDSHSIGRLRVIGILSNLPGFAEAFNCPVGSPMNPEKKCNLWK